MGSGLLSTQIHQDSGSHWVQQLPKKNKFVIQLEAGLLGLLGGLLRGVMVFDTFAYNAGGLSFVWYFCWTSLIKKFSCMDMVAFTFL